MDITPGEYRRTRTLGVVQVGTVDPEGRWVEVNPVGLELPDSIRLPLEDIGDRVSGLDVLLILSGG